MEDYTFTFTDRDSYISWRNEWRKNYRVLSSDIRELKNAIRDRAKLDTRPGNQSKLVPLRYEAAYQMGMRMASKVEAQKQYKLSKSKIEMEVA